MADTIGRADYEVGLDRSRLGPELKAAENQIKSVGAATEQALGQRSTASVGKLTGATQGLGTQVGGLKNQLASSPISRGVLQGVGLGAGLGAIGLITGAVSGVVTVIGDSIKSASDLNETITKSDVIFGNNAGVIKEWAKTAADSMGQSEKQALDTASGFAGLFQTVGIGTTQATDFAMKLTGLGSDLASFFNTDVSTALESLRSGLAGEAEPLRKFNIFLSETAVNAKLVSMGVKPVAGAFTEAQKATARYRLILEQTGSAQGDFARTSTGLANSQRINSAEAENMSAHLGAVFMKITQSLMPAFRGLIEFMDNVGVPVITGLVNGLGELGTAFDTLHRFVDPNYDQQVKLDDALRKSAEAAGLNADAVVQFAKAQRDSAAASAEATKQREIDADASVAFSEVDRKARMAQAQAMIDQQVAQYGLSQAEREQMMVNAGLLEGTDKVTTADEDLAAANAITIASFRESTHQAANYGITWGQVAGSINQSNSDLINGINSSAQHQSDLFRGIEGGYAATLGNIRQMEADSLSRSNAIAKAIGEGIPASIAQGALSASHLLVDGISALRDLLKNGFSPKQLAAQAMGERFGRDLARGFRSSIPGAKDAAQSLAVDSIAAIQKAGLTGPRAANKIGGMVGQLYASGLDAPTIQRAVKLAGGDLSLDSINAMIAKANGPHGSHNAGEGSGKKFSSGIRSEKPDAHKAGGELSQSGLDGANRTKSAWSTGGASLARAWGSGFIATLAQIRAGIVHELSSIGRMHIPTSPIREGPLVGIETAGAKLAKAWSDGFIANLGIGNIRHALSAAIPKMPTIPKMVMPTLATPGLGTFAMNGGQQIIRHEGTVRHSIELSAPTIAAARAQGASWSDLGSMAAMVAEAAATAHLKYTNPRRFA